MRDDNVVAGSVRSSAGPVSIIRLGFLSCCVTRKSVLGQPSIAHLLGHEMVITHDDRSSNRISAAP